MSLLLGFVFAIKDWEGVFDYLTSYLVFVPDEAGRSATSGSKSCGEMRSMTYLALSGSLC